MPHIDSYLSVLLRLEEIISKKEKLEFGNPEVSEHNEIVRQIEEEVLKKGPVRLLLEYHQFYEDEVSKLIEGINEDYKEEIAELKSKLGEQQETLRIVAGRLKPYLPKE